MSHTVFVWGVLVLVLCIGLGEGSTRITYPGCDRAGWKCHKLQMNPVRYEIEYVCPNSDGINFALWNFNGPVDMKYLKITNCTSVEIDLSCTNVGRQIEGLHILNVTVLNFTNILYKDITQMPAQVILEDIFMMPRIPEKIFKQMKFPSTSTYKCAATKLLEKIRFTNVNIGDIDQDAFYNLTNMKTFEWRNVRVNKMNPLAVHVEMERNQNFEITNCVFDKMDYKSFGIRSPGIHFVANTFNELPRNVIDSTSFNFTFINNSVQIVHSFAYILLSQDITFENNNFGLFKTSALQGIGPGLLENAFMSFGRLQFKYNFNNNSILHSDIGGIHPDWKAYKNVHSSLTVQSNYLPCSCVELGWITLRGGLGSEFSSMMRFNSKYLDENNNNLCLDSPCRLPLTVMAGMHIKFGLCGPDKPLIHWCENNKSNNHFGLSAMGEMVLKKWENDFTSSPSNSEELSPNEIETLEDMYALTKQAQNNYLQTNTEIFKSSNGNPKESYFKIEQSGAIDPIKLIESLAKSSNLSEIIEPELTSSESNFTESSPDIVFQDDDDVLDNNRTPYSYNLDIRNGMNATNSISNSTDPEFTVLKNEYEDNQRNFVKKTFEQWQAQRKKRMVYFKVYGNLITVG